MADICWNGMKLTPEDLAFNFSLRDDLMKYLAANRARLMAAGKWGAIRVEELDGVLAASAKIKEARYGKRKKRVEHV